MKKRSYRYPTVQKTPKTKTVDGDTNAAAADRSSMEDSMNRKQSHVTERSPNSPGWSFHVCYGHWGFGVHRNNDFQDQVFTGRQNTAAGVYNTTWCKVSPVCVSAVWFTFNQCDGFYNIYRWFTHSVSLVFEASTLNKQITEQVHQQLRPRAVTPSIYKLILSSDRLRSVFLLIVCCISICAFCDFIGKKWRNGRKWWDRDGNDMWWMKMLQFVSTHVSCESKGSVHITGCNAPFGKDLTSRCLVPTSILNCHVSTGITTSSPSVGSNGSGTENKTTTQHPQSPRPAVRLWQTSHVSYISSLLDINNTGSLTPSNSKQHPTNLIFDNRSCVFVRRFHVSVMKCLCKIFAAGFI